MSENRSPVPHKWGNYRQNVKLGQTGRNALGGPPPFEEAINGRAERWFYTTLLLVLLLAWLVLTRFWPPYGGSPDGPVNWLVYTSRRYVAIEWLPVIGFAAGASALECWYSL